jgi:hypothetical protein
VLLHLEDLLLLPLEDLGRACHLTELAIVLLLWLKATLLEHAPVEALSPTPQVAAGLVLIEITDAHDLLALMGLQLRVWVLLVILWPLGGQLVPHSPRLHVGRALAELVKVRYFVIITLVIIKIILL